MEKILQFIAVTALGILWVITKVVGVVLMVLCLAFELTSALVGAIGMLIGPIGLLIAIGMIVFEGFDLDCAYVIGLSILLITSKSWLHLLSEMFGKLYEVV